MSQKAVGFDKRSWRKRRYVAPASVRRNHALMRDGMRTPVNALLPKRSCGFTLIELVTIMMVIAIMAFVALPRFNLIDGYDEIGYRDSVTAALQFARKAAIAQRRVVSVVIAGNDVTLQIQPNVPEEAAAGTLVNLALPSADRRCGGATNMVCHPANVTLTPAATITFDAQGRATGVAGTYTIAGATNTLTVTVESETGYVH